MPPLTDEQIAERRQANVAAGRPPNAGVPRRWSPAERRAQSARLRLAHARRKAREEGREPLSSSVVTAFVDAGEVAAPLRPFVELRNAQAERLLDDLGPNGSEAQRAAIAIYTTAAIVADAHLARLLAEGDLASHPKLVEKLLASLNSARQTLVALGIRPQSLERDELDLRTIAAEYAQPVPPPGSCGPPQPPPVSTAPGGTSVRRTSPSPGGGTHD